MEEAWYAIQRITARRMISDARFRQLLQFLTQTTKIMCLEVISRLSQQETPPPRLLSTPPLPLSKINPDCIHLARNEFQCPLDRWAAVWNALHTANAMRSIPGVGGARDNRPGARNGGGRGLHVRHDANPLTIRCQKRKNHGVFLNWKTLNKKNNEVLKSA